MDVVARALTTIRERKLTKANAPVVLMVSGGSDSTALAYVADELRKAGELGAIEMLHVNHMLRGEDADADERFVEQLAALLEIPLRTVKVDVAQVADEEHGNVEAIARRERYRAASEALSELCRACEVPVSNGRLFVAHTADDRIENFYMRSIVGTGPGGFRSMRYVNGNVARPLLDITREDLRAYIAKRAERGLPIAQDGEGGLWCEDATNEHTDRFRAFVRHEIVPHARERNPRLATTLTRTMNLIADEDDMLEGMTSAVIDKAVAILDQSGGGFLVSPEFAREHVCIQRRCAYRILERMLDADERVENASIDAILAGFDGLKPNSGYVANIQGNIAVSANKQGVRIEPMAAFRTRRNRA